jgi:fumarylacetoacetase
MAWPNVDHTHVKDAASWVESANGHPAFPVQNLPLCIFLSDNGRGGAGTAIGDKIFDLSAAGEAGLLPGAAAQALGSPALNPFFALAAADRLALRHRLFELLTDAKHADRLRPLMHDAAASALHLPADIGDYTDFYVGIHHALNVGKQFRPDNPLLPNYKYVPIGYHGRASSIRPSGAEVTRPDGQRKAPDADAPSFGPSQRLDYELELGIWIGRGNELGKPIPIGEAAEHVAGFGLVNDWSARDIQAWEYQPLGPFLAKNFLTSVSPFVVTAEALAPFRTAQAERPDGDPQPLPYLFDEADQQGGAFAIALEVSLATEKMRAQGLAPHRIAQSDSRHMYWTVAQLVAHHSSNGCNLRPGDLLGSGTISGPDLESCGSLLEATVGGTKAIKLPSGEKRTFLEDGDEVIMTASASHPDFATIGFGECRGIVVGR